LSVGLAEAQVFFVGQRKWGGNGRVGYNCRLVMLYSNFTFSLMIRSIYFSATHQLVDLFSHLQKVMTIPWVEVEKSGLVFIRVYDLHTGRWCWILTVGPSILLYVDNICTLSENI